jgi:hypothetical protein
MTYSQIHFAEGWQSPLSTGLLTSRIRLFKLEASVFFD